VLFSSLKCRNQDQRLMVYIERCHLSGHFGQEEEIYRQEKNEHEDLSCQSGIPFAATNLGRLRTYPGRVKARRIFLLWDSCRHWVALYVFLLRRDRMRLSQDWNS
jgi:hypothetical protein